MKSNSWNNLKNYCNTETIAIIGNAPSALDYEVGDLIDQSQSVIRINDYEVRPEFAKNVGTKTDIYLTSFYQKQPQRSERELIEQNVKVIWSGVPYDNYVDHWKNDVDDGQRKIYPSYKDKIFVPSIFQFLNTSPDKEFKIIKRHLLYKMFGLRLFKMLGYKWPVPTSGSVGITMAVACKPKQVIITGFNFHSSKQLHYYSKTQQVSKVTHHQHDREPLIMTKIVKTNPKVNFILAIEPTFVGIKDLVGLSNVKFIEPIKTAAEVSVS